MLADIVDTEGVEERIEPDVEEWMFNIKKCRKDYDVSQDVLAEAAGITRTYYSLLEIGKKRANIKLLERFEEALELFNPDKQTEILFDYVRIRFTTNQERHVIEDIMNIKMEHMLEEGHAFYGYGSQYFLGDIVVMISPDEEKGVLLELKGRGCRQFEAYLKVQKRTWYDFFRAARADGAVFKRIDIAINDRAGILSIPELIKKCERDECVSLFHSYKDYGSGSLIRSQEEEKATMGSTLYLGSLKSEIYFCIYEKDYEQYVKNGVPLSEAETKNRFEIRLKDSRAEHAVTDLIEHEDAAKTAFSIINHYVRFVDSDETKEKRSWELNKRWAWFISGEERQLKLTTKPEPYTLERAIAWLCRQVAPTLKMVKKLDGLRGTNTVEEMIEAAKLSPQHQKILKQQMTDIEEMVTAPQEEAEWQKSLRQEYMGAIG